MTTDQKKAFIANLTKQVETSKNADFKVFLEECIEIYEDEVQESSASPDLMEFELQERLRKAVLLHDILRTTFEVNENGQVIGRVHEIDDLPNPVVKCVLENGVLTIDYHHISLDGWSIDMLINELLYNQFPEIAPSFAEFANRFAGQTELFR